MVVLFPHKHLSRASHDVTPSVFRRKFRSRARRAPSVHTKCEHGRERRERRARASEGLNTEVQRWQSRDLTFLEATGVEEFDGEWMTQMSWSPPTVQARTIVVGGCISLVTAR